MESIITSQSNWLQLQWICTRRRSSCTPEALPGPTLAAAATTREGSSLGMSGEGLLQGAGDARVVMMIMVLVSFLRIVLIVGHDGDADELMLMIMKLVMLLYWYW